MITFKQYLNEVADVKVPFEITMSNSAMFRAEAIINWRKIRFIADFLNNGDYWDVVFVEVNDDGTTTANATQSGGEFEVAAFVISAMKAFIEKHNPKKIMFTASKTKDDSSRNARTNVYLKLLKRHFPKFDIDVSARTSRTSEFQMTLSENLFEVADLKVQYEVIRAGADTFKAEALVGDRKIMFKAFDTADVEEGWDVSFFEIDKKSGLATTDVTGSGYEFEVAAFVVAAMQEFVQRYQPSIISFTSEKGKFNQDKNNRTAVYLRLLKRKFPMYEIEVDSNKFRRTDVVYLRLKD